LWELPLFAVKVGSRQTASMTAESYWKLGNTLVAVAFAQGIAFALALGKDEKFRNQLLKGPAWTYVGIGFGTVAYLGAIHWTWHLERQFFKDGWGIECRTSKSLTYGRMIAVTLINLGCAGAFFLQK
jgi:hypothetical protein